MEKLCPFMSGFLGVNRDGSPDIIIPEFQWAYCLKEQCALWKSISMEEENNKEGYCSLTVI